MSESLIERLERAKGFLKERMGTLPKYVLTLGSGLSELANEISVEVEFPLSEIPFLRVPTVKGHSGKVVVGRLDGVRVLGMQGRLHYYEGYPMADVVFPFRAFAYSGAETFLLTNASGGVDPKLRPADLVLIGDHINLMGANPLIGPNEERLGPRFPDLSDTYSKTLRERIQSVATHHAVPLSEGIYLSCSGPSYETPAEVAMYRTFGATVVGMSTVPEAIALRHMGKRVAAISCVTNPAAGLSEVPLAHSDVLDVAKQAYPKLSKLLKKTVQSLEDRPIP